MESFAMKVAVLVLAAVHSTKSAPLSSDHTVSFSVGLSSTQNVYNKDTIKYDIIFVNEHNGYNPSTGVFTCPVPGLYVFHFHAYSSNKDTIMWLDLLHNGNVMVSVSGYNSHTVGSQTVLLKLQLGDRVQIQSKESQEFALFGLPQQIYSTFTGYVLHPDSHQHLHDSGSAAVGK
ncbi:complement C1q-like protein 2 [Mercenaria mercenaria]|uniref:complement C1q-like protein 2 n=1 Tax=Mercenaria mercenaria TaxID=6596 RepID=UPI00234EB568|nr:complement C1q-like protein 2 [Mercenaria mercenaria]